MKIDSYSKPVGSPLVKEARSTSAKPAAPAPNDAVKLSGLSNQLRASDDGQAFDPVRVAEIKQAISEGRFTINASAIADRLINSTKEFVDSQRQG